MKKIISQEDNSVNFVFGEEEKDYLESRYVRRLDDYIVCYISVKKGCSKGCKFCHLTTTGQTSETDATMEEILEQAQYVYNHYQEMVQSGKEKSARVVHFNFMARGEPLSSKIILNHNEELFLKLSEIFSELRPKYNISTIMPTSMGNTKLTNIFRNITPTIYYSMYSIQEDFRTNWLPNALPIDKALENLKEYQEDTKKIIKIHHTLIKDENDNMENAIGIADIIKKYNLLIEYQIVRYNSYSEEEGAETDEENIEAFISQLKALMPTFQIKMINRVGHDVYASCGMFYY
jgi:adenine C2-methylase RlmN of 23S rRNA A2503 and tRNA A37